MNKVTECLFRLLFVLLVFVTGYSVAQDDKTQVINLEELRIGNASVVQGIDSVSDQGYYRYINKASVINEFGQPDEVQTRNDELMETEIVRARYGASYIEFFDQSFGEELHQDEYNLLNIELNDAEVWLQYQGDTLKIGEEFPKFYQQVDDNHKSVMALRRGILNEMSDYVLTIQFERKQINSITATFD